MVSPSVLLRSLFAASVLSLSIAQPAAATVCVDAHVRPTGLPLNPVILESMMKEADAIWAPYGVVIRWMVGSHPEGCASAASSIAVQVDNNGRRGSTARPLTLGMTRRAVSRAGSVPIRLDYGAVERLLGSLTADTLGRVVGRQHLAPADVGRALGRVLAHEVGHVLLAGPGHRRRGLMRPSFVPSELVDSRRRSYTLSSAEIAAIAARGGSAGQSPEASMTDD